MSAAHDPGALVAGTCQESVTLRVFWMAAATTEMFEGARGATLRSTAKAVVALGQLTPKFKSEVSTEKEEMAHF